jgi:lipoprotein-anchoring transpeptidase ErfK/SrfK
MKALGMNRTRWTALGVVVAVTAAGGVAWGIGAAGGDERDAAAAVDETTSTTKRSTTTTEAPTTTTEAPTTTTAPPPDDVLERGERGEEVAALQRRLTELKLDPGPADGSFGVGTMYAVQAFQKLNGMAPDGKVGAQVREALAAPATPQPLMPNGGPDRVEVDLRSQLLFLYKGGELRLVSHVSTGNNETYCVEGSCNNRAVTPVGAFRFSWRYSGWRESRLGKLYNPVYFTSSGVAVHGSTSVPTYPASHGCVRIPMHIAEYFPSLVRSGDPVYVLDGVTTVSPKPAPAPSGPPPDDPPTTPEDEPTTTTTTAPPPEESPSTTTTTPPPGEGDGDDQDPATPTTPSTTVPA